MARLNHCSFIGRLGQDPKLAYLPSGQPVAEFNLAVDESYKKDGEKHEQTTWVPVKVFGKTAEFCANYLSKGKLAFVVGRFNVRSWEGQDGQRQYRTEIYVSGPSHDVQPLEWAEREGQDRPSSRPTALAAHSPARGGQARSGGSSGEDLGPAFPDDPGGMDSVPF